MKRIVWTEPAKADIRRLDRETAMRIFATLHRFADSGEGDVKALQGREEVRGPLQAYCAVPTTAYCAVSLQGHYAVRIQAHHASNTINYKNTIDSGSFSPHVCSLYIRLDYLNRRSEKY